MERASRYSAVVIGPGLGRFMGEDKWLGDLLSTIKAPLVLDADALNILADHPELIKLRDSEYPTVLTPHPGEMARLLHCSISEVESSRLSAARTVANHTGMIVVLKGRYTIIAYPTGKQVVNIIGSPALSKAGSGDLLAGLLGSLLAQRIPANQAVPMATYLHGQAGVIASQTVSEHAVCYQDIIVALGKAFEQLPLS
jgi:NAD(P)H-hydrate epimerase